MSPGRRRFLLAAGSSVAAKRLAGFGHEDEPRTAPAASQALANEPDWVSVRDQFSVDPQWAHFASFFLTSHPRPVREEIDRLRRAIDENPFGAVHDGFSKYPDEARRAAASYLGARPEEVTLTHSTTDGLAFIYAGLQLQPGSEVLTTAHEHFVHHESIRLAASRSAATVRRVALYDNGAAASEDEIVSRLRRSLRPQTRVVGITWVHSSTGVKLPLRGLATAIADVNRSRDRADRILLVVDGVHGFGVEDETVTETGCDFFAAGTHKWIFGPRGTGVVWGRLDAWSELRPTVPTFDAEAFGAWMEQRDPSPRKGAPIAPGGFRAFEHAWALPAAFAFHRRIGRARVATRIHDLNARIKEGLAGLRHVTLHTPRHDRLSAGLVCFEVAGMPVENVVQRLREHRIIASESPYRTPFVRLAGSLLNTSEEIDRAVRAVAALA